MKRNMIQGQPIQFLRPLPPHTHISTNKKLDVVACACHPGNTGRINRRIIVQASLGINA
jgi:hypothetical protein